MHLGVCYYPEHWPQARWSEDAAQMAELGLTRVRIGEFAWSRFEPEPGQYNWDWFDQAIDTLHAAGLGIILGTPTATPPKWLVDQMPDMLACDEYGRPRQFGSRRHYCFSHSGYRQECRRIVTEMAQRYGNHPGVVMWQTDNEYGCHNTVESYSNAAQHAFRDWLRDRHKTIDALNAAWGTVFWSQEYRSFDEINLPGATVTEANPSHRLDFQRFSSDQVIRFNREQVEILRQHSPGRDITHNLMGIFTAFDHHKLGEDLDLASWDSYPLGFLEQSRTPDADKALWLRQGHPDFQAFHHDLYRGCSPKWGVMEQQPGPVNWAPFNPAPLPGMVRLWSLEALAHGADLVSWFRWRQVPFAQEHMHAGLLRPDADPAPAFEEARAVAEALPHLKDEITARADIALVFDYEGQWTHAIQPQGQGLDLWHQAYDAYCALRRLGFSIDIVAQHHDVRTYKMIVIPGVPILRDELLNQLHDHKGRVVVLPRTGSKTQDFHIPDGLPPNRLQQKLGLKVTRVESLRTGFVEHASYKNDPLEIVHWRENLELAAHAEQTALARFEDDTPLWVRSGSFDYLAGWLSDASADQVFFDIAETAGLAPIKLGKSLRFRRLGSMDFAFNYGSDATNLEAFVPRSAQFVIGDRELPAAGVAAWRV